MARRVCATIEPVREMYRTARKNLNQWSGAAAILWMLCILAGAFADVPPPNAPNRTTRPAVSLSSAMPVCHCVMCRNMMAHGKCCCCCCCHHGMPAPGVSFTENCDCGRADMAIARIMTQLGMPTAAHADETLLTKNSTDYITLREAAVSALPTPLDSPPRLRLG